MKPNGYAIWENIQHELDRRIKETGHKNVYFPLFVPLSSLAKEAEHVAGFAKESAVVTHHRLMSTPQGIEVDPGSKLDEEVIIRPTSEAIMYQTFSKWIQSWRDLPLLVNQWANVVRWELRTKLFLRTTEFLWQEGHTVHATQAEAQEETLKMLEVYRSFAEEFLAMSPVAGQKSEAEKFPGALKTYTIEALMQDGKALQAGTSHNLGDNFSKAFDIKYTDENGTLTYAWQTSWGMSTRIIGGLIMTHSDDRGLVLPPKVAPVQVVIIPIWKDLEDMKGILAFAEEVKQKLEKVGIRAELDSRDYQTPGYKFNEWEKRGTPIRIEIGRIELENKELKAVNRVDFEKKTLSAGDCSNDILEMLKNIQQQLLANAKSNREKNTNSVDSYEEFKTILETKKGFIKAFWCQDPKCEEIIKQETKATTRCLPLETVEESGKCVYCGKSANHRWLFAQSY